jgi:hypothetical protein
VTIFDLFFLLSVIASVIMLVALGILILRGQRERALTVVKIFGLYVASYCALAVGVDLLRPQRVIAIGAPWCFDDWCIRVESSSHAADGSRVRYSTQLRIFSTARGISQRAPGAWIYLIDEQGHRFAPIADSTALPLTVWLAPEQSVNTSRNFEVPADAHILGLVTGHGGAFCGWSILIVGEGGCLFNRPTMIRLHSI